MIISVHINNSTYKVDLSAPIDISIPLLFNDEQPNTYDAEKARATTYETSDFIGDTRRGGSCNFETYTLTPHCNGTHTECIGHITHKRISVRNSLSDCFIPSTLITVEVADAADTGEIYLPSKNSTDKIITKKSIQNVLGKAEQNWLQALIIRTLPNNESKKTRRYMKTLPPFFSTEAMNYILERKVKHLLVDIPSLDRTFDEGKLSAHHIFWQMPQGSNELSVHSNVHNTITEMIFVPDHVKDGIYLLNLQITAFAADASPSRPVIFNVLKQKN